MDASFLGDEGFDPSAVHLLHPPENLRPEENFKRLLSEYQLWTRHNQDRGYAIFLKATQELALSENTPWEIRQMIRGMEEGPSVPQEDLALKWHFILHLAREIEENRVGAEKILKQMKKQKSPLEDALGERTASPGLFEDLPLSETQPLMEKHHLKQIFEAWLGLFGEYLPDHDPGLLITFDRHVWDYASDIFEEKDIGLLREEALPPELALSQDYGALKHLPRLCDEGSIRNDPVMAGLAGKTIILLDG
jgi:hypothetical protein